MEYHLVFDTDEFLQRLATSIHRLFASIVGRIRNPTLHRQGDVLLQRVWSFPPRLVARGDGVVALGEMTGHRHRFEAGAVVYASSGGEAFVEVTANVAELIHEEHATIRLRGPAYYRVVMQREFDPRSYDVHGRLRAHVD